jgi:hypothetical protein
VSLLGFGRGILIFRERSIAVVQNPIADVAEIRVGLPLIHVEVLYPIWGDAGCEGKMSFLRSH